MGNNNTSYISDEFLDFTMQGSGCRRLETLATTPNETLVEISNTNKPYINIEVVLVPVSVLCVFWLLRSRGSTFLSPVPFEMRER